MVNDKNEILESAILRNMNFFMDMADEDFGTAAYIGPFIVNNLSVNTLNDNFYIYNPSNKDHTWEKLTFFRMMMIVKSCMNLTKIDYDDPQWRSKRARGKYCINQLREQVKEYIGPNTYANMDQVAPYKRKLEFMMADYLLKILDKFVNLPLNVEMGSFIINSAPIVPYSGIVKKLNTEVKKEDEDDISVYGLESFFELEFDGKYDDPFMNASHIKDETETALLILFANNFPIILNSINKSGTLLTEEAFLNMLCDKKKKDPTEWFSMIAYYNRMGLSDTKLRQKASDIVSGKYFSQSLEALIEDASMEYNPQADLNKLNKPVDLYSDLAPKTGSYPLNNINNYIDKHRELQPSENISK